MNSVTSNEGSRPHGQTKKKTPYHMPSLWLGCALYMIEIWIKLACVY